MNKNIKENIIKNLKFGESKFIEEIEKNNNLSYEKRNMENIEIVTVYYKSKENIEMIDEFEFDENENYVGLYEEEGIKRREFILYERLDNEQKIHLADFDIINSIENATEKEFTQKEKNELFDTIKRAWLKDETNTALSTIADIIVETYARNEISLETLNNADPYEILDCAIGMGDFENLENIFPY